MMLAPVPSRTCTRVLAALHDPGDDEVWSRLDARYRPVLVGLGRRLGLDDEEAREAAQETMAQVARDYLGGRYDRGKGRLRSWVIAIARHRVLDATRRRARRRNWRGESAFDAVPDEPGLTRVWTEETEKVVFRQAMAELKASPKLDPRTLVVFERVTLGGVPPRTVAEEFAMSIDDVYRVKNRITNRLRSIVERLTKAWDETP